MKLEYRKIAAGLLAIALSCPAPGAFAQEIQVKAVPGPVELPWLKQNVKPLTLAEARDYVVQKSPLVRAARYDVEAKELLLSAAKTGCLPKSSANLNAGYDENGKPVVFSSVGVSVPLFWGNINSNKRLAAEQLSISQLESLTAANRAILEVTQVYYEVLYAQRMAAYYGDSVRQLEEQARVINALYKTGRALRSDTLKIEAELSKAKVDLMDAEGKRGESMRTLNQLLDSETGDFQLAEDEYLPLALMSSETLELAKESPEYKLIEAREKRAELEWKSEKWNTVQDFNLSGRYQRNDASYVSSEDHNQFVVGLAGGMNLWDWGEKKKIRKSKEADYKKAGQEKISNIRDFETEVKNLYEAIRIADFEVQAANRTMLSLQEQYESDLVRLKYGRLKVEDFLSTRKYLSEARLQYEEARLRRSQAKAGLQSRLGIWDLSAYENRGLDLPDKDFLELLEKRAFEYFRNEYDPYTGLFLDASGGGQISVGGTGFGLAALVIGADRGWMTKEEAESRTMKILDTLVWLQENGRTYEGFFYHFLTPRTAERAGSSEVSNVDTALLLTGVLTAAQYFGGEVAAKTERLYRNIHWEKFLIQEGDKKGIFYLEWTPENGLFEDYLWDHYTDETLLMVLFALGSPVSDAPPGIYSAFYRKEMEYGGYRFYPSWSGSLFTYQYANLFFNFRNYRDPQGIDWFENAVNATKAQLAYARDHGKDSKAFREGYWGISSGELPDGSYDMMIGVRPNLRDMDEFEGILVPSSVAGAVEFVPEDATASLKKIYRELPQAWGPYGFTSSFDLDKGWFSSKYYALDLGMTLIALDNYAHGTVHKFFMQSPYVRQALGRAGFTFQNNNAVS